MTSQEISATADLASHAGFARLLDYVEAKRAGRRWARRSDIDPCDIPGLLPHLWLIEIGSSRPRLLVRLAGTRIETVYDRSLTGRYLEDLDWGLNSTRIFASLNSMADHGKGHFLDVSARIKPRLVRRVQRLGLPLSEDQQRVSHLILLAFYEFEQGERGKMPPDHFREFWLDLPGPGGDIEGGATGRNPVGALNESA
jgi:hypothetical protein